MKRLTRFTLPILFCLCVVRGTSARERWTSDEANRWYAGQPWVVGCDFLPSTAINQLEMWQADTFDPETIDRELGWAHDIGLSGVRVYLHDIPWREDRDGYFRRIDQFLAICARHEIKVVFVLFDGVWDPDPQPGVQNRPRPGVHNSGWVQSPGRVILRDPQAQDRLEGFVTETVARHADDDRVWVWDPFNEPDNSNGNSYAPLELPNKDEVAARLVRKSFDWARAAGPSQPLTVGLWHQGPWNEPENLSQTQQAALELSDVVSFHDYGPPSSLTRRIEELRGYDRPLICTEYMARGNGSTFADNLPVFKAERVAAFNWGLVDGKSQTKYPWTTWQQPIIGEPEPWHHDIFHADGTPYSQAEVDLIRELTAQ
ncbi:MAG: cellulase family glycosylhydrolase [Pirellulales bacterium]